MAEETEEGAEDHPVVYALRIGARAERDVTAATARFADLAGDEVAREWQRGLFAALASLAENPRRFPVASESHRFSEEARQYVYRRSGSSVAYRLLYFVQDNGPDGNAHPRAPWQRAADQPGRGPRHRGAERIRAIGYGHAGNERAVSRSRVVYRPIGTLTWRSFVAN